MRAASPFVLLLGVRDLPSVREAALVAGLRGTCAVGPVRRAQTSASSLQQHASPSHPHGWSWALPLAPCGTSLAARAHILRHLRTPDPLRPCRAAVPQVPS
eukprot:scaffold3586_cov404-Prasinococcus_capsulatus_cf.AAC.37